MLRGSPQDPNSPYVVFFRTFWLDDDDPSTQRGHFEVFDAQGHRRRTDNVLDGHDRVVPFRRNGALAIYHRSLISGDAQDAWVLSTLKVTRLDDLSSPGLHVVLGPARPYRDEAPVWDWQLRDPGGPGAAEIQIGPRARGVVAPAATYRFNEETERFEGPEGSASQSFLRVTPSADCNPSAEMKDYALVSLRLQGFDKPPVPRSRTWARVEGRETSTPEGWLYEYRLTNRTRFNDISRLRIGGSRTVWYGDVGSSQPIKLEEIPPPISTESPEGWRITSSPTGDLPFYWSPQEVDFQGPRIGPGDTLDGFRLLFAKRCEWCARAEVEVEVEDFAETRGNAEPWNSTIP